MKFVMKLLEGQNTFLHMCPWKCQLHVPERLWKRSLQRLFGCQRHLSYVALALTKKLSPRADQLLHGYPRRQEHPEGD